MRVLKKYPKFFKFTCLATISSSAGWLLYQVRSTKNILTNALDTSILSIAEPTKVENVEDEKFLVVNVSRSQYRGIEFWSNAWNSVKFAFAKRLLTLANSDNKYIRKMAVQQLAKIRNLDNWQYAMLSSMIDSRTAVGLARTPDVEPRFFASPPVRYLGHTHDMIVDVMKDLLVKLHTLSQHPCMGYFISKAFPDEDFEKYADDYASFELKKYIQASEELLPMCLESLLHHASIKDYAKHIAELNGLSLLMEIHNRFKENILVDAAICRILSYLSMHNELLEELYKSGWIAVLAQWVKHEDVRISIPAAKALANLDSDETSVYFQRLYLLHPSTRVFDNANVDVVFVHGLLGGVFFTWRQRKRRIEPPGLLGKSDQLESLRQEDRICDTIEKKIHSSSDPEMREFMEIMEQQSDSRCICADYDVVWEDIPVNTNVESTGPYCCPGSKYAVIQKPEDAECVTKCWPRDWLADDCANLRIIGVNYETNLSMWAPLCPVEKVKTLSERSDELITQLTKVQLGKRPIVWVTHSMGGLMVKCLLNKAATSCDENIRKLYLKTQGIVFYSTPHTGSSVANFSQASALVIWPSVEVQELKKGSPQLIDIHQNFLEIIKKHPQPVKIITFVETKPTIVSAMKFKFLVVEPESGNLGCGEYYEIPLDHLGICKPASRCSFLYQKVLHMIQDISDKKNNCK